MSGIALVRRASLCEGRCMVMTDDDVNVSADKAEVEKFLVMSPVVFEVSDEEFEEFLRIVESDPVADERLARLFERPSPFGQHIELDS